MLKGNRACEFKGWFHFTHWSNWAVSPFIFYPSLSEPWLGWAFLSHKIGPISIEAHIPCGAHHYFFISKVATGSAYRMCGRMVSLLREKERERARASMMDFFSIPAERGWLKKYAGNCGGQAFCESAERLERYWKKCKTSAAAATAAGDANK